jgi:DNA-binding transcriptional regulator YhcF (GntR family)
MGRSRTVITDVVEQLRRHIKQCHRPGEALPSQREFAATLGSTHSTVHRALLKLAEEKLVETHPREGWFRTDSPAPVRHRATKALRLGIISRKRRCDWERDQLLTALLKAAAQRSIDIVEVPNPLQSYPTPNRRRISPANVPWNTFDVGLLVGIEDPFTLNDPLLKKHLVLSVDQDSTSFGLNSVAFANHEAGALAARHLFDLGHRRFAVTDEVNCEGYVCDPSWMARRHGFEAALGWLGGILRPEWRLEIKRSGLAKRLSLDRTVERWSREPREDRPTALFVNEGIERIMPALHGHGLRVPQDISIVAADWRPVEWCGVQFTSIYFDLGQLIDRVFQTAADIFNGNISDDQKPVCIRAPMLLFAGQSTCATVPKNSFA